ncbi:MAG: hypothetical protein JXR95_05395 [Deltaproteobacteria bacterium]|nr:hypothetical protein [Deltaproteobacteria bacterium]
MKILNLLVMFIVLSSCGGEKKETPVKTENQPNSVDVKNTKTKEEVDSKNNQLQIKKDLSTPKIIKKIKVPKTYDEKFDDLAKIISGLRVSENSPYAVVMKEKSWKAYEYRINDLWKSTVEKKMGIMQKWSQQELSDIHKESGVLFYPFSGPDFLHAQILFPSADETVMIGLEPIGSVPDINEINKNGLRSYLKKVEATLEHILKLSFFRTVSMKAQMFNKDYKEIDGTLPTLMFFMARMGNKILNIEKVVINSDGKLVAAAQMKWDRHEALGEKSDVSNKKSQVTGDDSVKKSEKLKVKKNKKAGKTHKKYKRKKGKSRRRKKRKSRVVVAPVYGNRITFESPDGKTRTLVYFSMNLSDGEFHNIEGLQKRKDVMNYLNSLKIITTYVKSASYLMYKSYFVVIRDFILSKTKYFLQDDSGMPIKYISGDKFTSTFYGTYSKPIKLFKMYTQKDLKKIYRENKNIKRLPFGIGYHIVRGNSNLQLFKRKNK